MFAVNRKVVKNCLFIRLAMFIYLTYHISVQCIRPLYFANESQMIKQVSLLKTEQNVDLIKHTCKLKLFNGTFYTTQHNFVKRLKQNLLIILSTKHVAILTRTFLNMYVCIQINLCFSLNSISPGLTDSQV